MAPKNHSFIVLAMLAGALAAVPSVRADDADAELKALREQIQALTQRVHALENQKQAETNAPAAAPAPRPGPILTVGDKGVVLESDDGNLRVRLGGYMQVDGRFYFGSGPGNDTFLVRRARPILEGTLFKDFDFRMMPDFAGSAVTLEDAYVNWRLRPQVQLQAGKFKAPVGLERLQSARDLAFPERGHPTSLVPNRDIGIELHGSLFGEKLDYALGVFDGAPDGGSVVVDSDNGEDFEGRLFTQPFLAMTNSLLKGLGFGLAGTYGHHDAAAAGYKTIGQQTFFSWANGVRDDGTLWRLAPQGYFYAGPFGLLGEYVLSSHEVRLGAERARLENAGWLLEATCVLTGERASYRGVKPDKPFNPADSGWGAVELAFRYTALDVDDAAFPRFANSQTSASAADTFGAGVNWYLNSRVKLSTDYSWTRFDGGKLGAVTKQDEHVLISRFQVAF